MVPRWVGVAALAVVLVALAGWLIGRSLSSSSPTHRTHHHVAASGYVAFHDPTGLFSGEYPAGWKRITTTNPAIVLLAQGPNGASYLVQKTKLNIAVGTSNLGKALALTARVVRSGKNVKLLRRPQALIEGGLPGFLYLYTFSDPTSGDIGAHAQYFLFDHKTMITLVFQTLPSNFFTTEAPTFTRIAATFQAGSQQTP